MNYKNSFSLTIPHY